jgi:hypothetical protein
VDDAGIVSSEDVETVPVEMEAVVDSSVAVEVVVSSVVVNNVDDVIS